jgi:predicted amidophosphoribosyltransferase
MNERQTVDLLMAELVYSLQHSPRWASAVQAGSRARLRQAVKHDLLWQWQDQDFAVFWYRPIRSKHRDAITDLILDFKTYNPDVVEAMQNIMVRAVEAHEERLRVTQCCRYILAIPPSTAGERSHPCEDVCAMVTRRHPWLTHLPGALQRTQTVQKSSWSSPGDRPDEEQHLRTIRYAGPVLDAGAGIILVDDIITRGATSGACRKVLRRATPCLSMPGMYLGRTG